VYSILGINRRNLEYIKKLNPQKNIRLADNKYKTKQFLEQRGIPVPKTYAYITDRKQLLHFDFGSFPSDVFVAKPNK
jgi:glutathione synthase/RimK-type ligase-like ATP-grasp enzyme